MEKFQRIELGGIHEDGLDIDQFGCGFDYTNQAWVINWKYYPCGHAAGGWPCNCYGRTHAGEPVRRPAEVN